MSLTLLLLCWCLVSVLLAPVVGRAIHGVDPQPRSRRAQRHCAAPLPPEAEPQRFRRALP